MAVIKVATRKFGRGHLKCVLSEKGEKFTVKAQYYCDLSYVPTTHSQEAELEMAFNEAITKLMEHLDKVVDKEERKEKLGKELGRLVDGLDEKRLPDFFTGSNS